MKNGVRDNSNHGNPRKVGAGMHLRKVWSPLKCSHVTRVECLAGSNNNQKQRVFSNGGGPSRLMSREVKGSIVGSFTLRGHPAVLSTSLPLFGFLLGGGCYSSRNHTLKPRCVMAGRAVCLHVSTGDRDCLSVLLL